MNTRVIKAVMVLVACVFSFVGGALTYKNCTDVKQAKLKVTAKSAVTYDPVVRNYRNESRDALIARLKAYDMAEPDVDVDFVQKDNSITAHVTASLYERNWSRDVTLQVQDDERIKIIVGSAVSGIIAGGVIAYYAATHPKDYRPYAAGGVLLASLGVCYYFL